ncbi:MAG: hypothetical protein ACUVUQ_11040 [Thermodesulfovibrionales bacterium]
MYIKANKRVVVPFHAGKILHPKIVRQILKATELQSNNVARTDR